MSASNYAKLIGTQCEFITELTADKSETGIAAKQGQRCRLIGMLLQGKSMTLLLSGDRYDLFEIPMASAVKHVRFLQSVTEAQRGAYA